MKNHTVEEIIANIRFISDDILSYSPDGEIATLCHELRKYTDILTQHHQELQKAREEERERIIYWLKYHGYYHEEHRALFKTLDHSKPAPDETELAYRGAYRSALLNMMNACIDSNPSVQKGWDMAITNMLSMFEPLEKPETPWGGSLVEKLKKTLNFRNQSELDQPLPDNK